MIQAHPLQTLHPNRRASDIGQATPQHRLPEPLLTLDQACGLLSLSASTLYRLAERRQIPFVKIGGALRFERWALAAWLDSQRKTPVSDWQHQPATPTITLTKKTTGGLK